MTPNNDEVICPNCVHQFRAIPVNVQARIAELEAALAASKAECGILDALLNDNDEALNAALRDDIVGMQRERIERLTALRQDAIAKEGDTMFNVVALYDKYTRAQLPRPMKISWQSSYEYAMARIAKLEAALRTISKATFICTKQLRDWECCTHEVQRVADAALAKESER